MTVERRIKLNNNVYEISVELFYKNKKVYKKSNFNDYFDFGDLSYLIENMENNYDNYVYDNEIPFMNEIIYMYDNIPFITSIKKINKDDSITMNVEDIENYIKENNIKLNNYYLNSVTPLFFK